MNQEAQQRGKWHKIQMWLLVGVVVGLPTISFIVNLYGSKTGQAFYSALKNNLGQFPTFNYRGWNNDTVGIQQTSGKVLVVSFASDSSQAEVMNVLKPIVKTDQFREGIDNLLFLTFDLKNDSTFYTSYISTLNNRDKELWHQLKGGQELASQIKLQNSFTVSLVDTAGVIRRFYDIRNPEDKRLLVEHISVMPIKKKDDVVKKDHKTL